MTRGSTDQAALVKRDAETGEILDRLSVAGEHPLDRCQPGWRVGRGRHRALSQGTGTPRGVKSSCARRGRWRSAGVTPPPAPGGRMPWRSARRIERVLVGYGTSDSPRKEIRCGGSPRSVTGEYPERSPASVRMRSGSAPSRSIPTAVRSHSGSFERIATLRPRGARSRSTSSTHATRLSLRPGLQPGWPLPRLGGVGTDDPSVGREDEKARPAPGRPPGIRPRPGIQSRWPLPRLGERRSVDPPLGRGDGQSGRGLPWPCPSAVSRRLAPRWASLASGGADNADQALGRAEEPADRQVAFRLGQWARLRSDPGHRVLATQAHGEAFNDRYQLWNPTTGESLVDSGPWDPISAPSFTEALRARGLEPPTGHPFWAAVAWSPDGKHIATLDRFHTIRIRDRATGNLVRGLEDPERDLVCPRLHAGRNPPDLRGHLQGSQGNGGVLGPGDGPGDMVEDLVRPLDRSHHLPRRSEDCRGGRRKRFTGPAGCD